MTDQKALKTYRTAIKAAWLPVVGRAELASQEYDLIKQWFSEGVTLPLVLRAIQQCAERAASKHITIYSLGVIRADLNALLKKQAKAQVGAHSQKDRAQWRTEWIRDLPILIEEYEFTGRPEAVTFLCDLQADLPNLDEDRARARLREFDQKFK